MRPRTRAAGIVACLSISALVLSAAMNSGGTPPATFVAPDSAAAPATESTTPATSPSGTAARPATQPQPEPPAGSLSAAKGVRELRTSHDNPPDLVLDASGTVRTVTAAEGEHLGASADKFVQRYAAAFGMTSGHTVSRQGATTLAGGDRVQRYQQRAAGLPIIGGEIVVTTDSRGRVLGAITDTTALQPVPAKTTVGEDRARATALAKLSADYGIGAADISTATVELWLYDAAQQGKGELRPTYWVKAIGAEGHELATVLVDAIDGTVRLAASEQRTARNRLICDLKNAKVNLNLRASYSCVPGSTLAGKPETRTEGETATGHSADANRAYDNLGRAYDYFKTTFGRDSYDGRGAQVRATVQACHTTGCPYYNAMWEGTQFVFGTGWATDDVAAHEFTHAVTEHASNLYYWHQSGAINEALSDIFGEFIDLSTTAGDGNASDDVNKRWWVGEDIRPGGGDLYGPIRNMMNPEYFGHPNTVGYGNGWDQDEDLLDNGGVHTNSGPANKAAALIADGGSQNGTTVTGIGLAKSAQLWYRVMHVLPSGANYEELSLALNAVCREFIGHHGFTAADCVSVTKAGEATYLHYPPGGNGIGESEDYVCYDNEPPVNIFFDDFEKPSTKWKASNTVSWQRIPSSSIAYSYAAHGKGSVNGWSAPGANGHGTYFEMAQAVQLPADKNPQLHFAQSMIKDPLWTASGIEAYISANGGAWQPLSVDPWGMPKITRHSQGFGSHRTDLSAYKGKSVKVRFKVASASTDLVDWYLDDFRIYYCDNVMGAPQFGYGYHTGGGASLNWSYPTFVSRIQDGNINRGMTYVWDLKFDPPIPGAPATVDPNNTSPYLNTVLLPGANPNTTYQVTITARTTEPGQPAITGAPLVVMISDKAPATCPTDPVPRSAWIVPRKPGKPLPYGVCQTAPTARR